ncbi:MAG: endonuclease/exonuclease/phosphatase family protein [Bacteroidia bacterium]|nr:endonuclease/exonuclease/phosphatase family protein [Bacteroidia bacterium]
MAYPYLLAWNILFVLLWAVIRKKVILISIITIGLGLSNVNRLVGLSLTNTNKEDIASEIQIMSYNAQSFHGKKEYPGSYSDLIKLIKSQDLVLLQEIPHHIYPRLTEDISTHKAYKEADLGLVIFSKYPILDDGVVNRQNASNGSIWVDLDIKEERVRVYNVHLQSYRLSVTTKELSNKKTWATFKDLLQRIKLRSQLRSDQVDLIEEHIQSCKYPIILGGDFNDTPVSYSYNQLSRGFQDSFCEMGKGFGTTYAGNIPLLRIDYIFTDSNFKILHHQVIDSPLSDHYPVKSVIRLQPK